MKAWRVEQHGPPEKALALREIPAPEPGPDEVRIAVSHTVLNKNDVDGCFGRYATVNPPLPYTAGMEVTGQVDAAGTGAEAWLGKRVVACPSGATGGYAEQAIAPVDMTFEAPSALEGSDAAGFFYPFHLSHLALHERAGLRAGETVLIHAAAGGVGSAAVQLAKVAGARVITTAGGEAKRDFCARLGADTALDYLAEDFAARTLEATEGRGVDVVFDTVGGSVTEQSFRCIARNGRHILVGFSAGIEAEDEAGITPRPLCFGNFFVGGVLLAYSADPAPLKQAMGWNFMPRSVGDAVHAELGALLAAQRVRPIVAEVVPFADLPRWLTALEERRTVGRIVVEVAG
ncbi:MAG: zinc-binding dehydrogenase [Myxococcota bacterium]